MDDYNVSVLSEAKNEYSLRLVTILYPLILEGIKSILKEAWELCLTNDEEEKYLMTFQNFLSRVTKWNQSIIEDETRRIVNKSKCAYLEDLLTCVHITQLKILTSIRVSHRQKKIEMDVPKLSDFVHKVYIKCARKFYRSVYLFEQKILPLQYQKNMRECETICKECILNVIRDNMPVEHILRSYMDESVEEVILEESVPPKSTKEETTDLSENAVATEGAAEGAEKEVKIVKSSEEMGSGEAVESAEKDSSDKSEVTPIVAATTEAPANVTLEVEEPPKKEEQKPRLVAPPTPGLTLPSPSSPVSINPIPTPASTPISSPIHQSEPPVLKVNTEEVVTKSAKLSFDDVDKVYSGETLKEELVSAPKTIDRLEEISKMRTAQRKAEEEEEDDANEESGNIKIHSDSADLDLDIKVLDKPF